jgi:taurine dioxygenase
MFANMYQAYEALPDATKQQLVGLRAVHDFAVAAASSGTYTADQLQDDDFDGSNRSIHPVMITHPDTGRKALFVNPGFTAALVGFASAESTALLEFLYGHAISSEFVYRHSWRPNDLVIWDNRTLMHYAVVDYEGVGERYMHRTTVIAERPQP